VISSMTRDPRDYKRFMLIALQEAKASLREGNKGFGAVLLKGRRVVVKAHDTPATASDPTAHAEMNLVRMAFRVLGPDLSGCVVISTHEPCPMCTGALVWAGVSEIVYGTSIASSKSQGRTMIDLSCREITKKSPWSVKVTGGVLELECSRLYDADVRKLVKALRSASGADLNSMSQDLLRKRTAWFDGNADYIRHHLKGTDVEKAYRLILMKIGIREEDAPIVAKSDNKIVFHSMNPCAALEACTILGLDTREVCRKHTERATDGLIKKINPSLHFTRNYDRLRPHAPYCEEIISTRA
jgi:tRNA(adenine34) deaminase